MFNSLGKNNSLVKSTTTIANSAIKAANVMSNVISESTSTIAENVNDTFQNVVNSGAKNIKMFNSLAFGGTGSNSSNGGTGSNSSNSSNGGTGGTGSNGPSASNSSAATSSWATALGIFLLLTLIFLAVLTLFAPQIKAAIENIIATLRKLIGKSSVDVKVEEQEPPILTPPSPSQVTTDKVQESKSIMDKILPLGSKEVFNVSSNNYTYYDAEPMCRALGAELASYSQVKDAWEKGADWCNYGWVKGQAAVYPTQNETWDKLQHGPEDEKYACGNPGVNGGYFDNPEMRFGVTCYGVKPPESSNDEKNMMANGTIPKTPATLKVDQQIQEYKNSLDVTGILPFNGNTWSK